MQYDITNNQYETWLKFNTKEANDFLWIRILFRNSEKGQDFFPNDREVSRVNPDF